jgi:DNA-directed RNA polymerase II subunit RPB9
MTAPRPACSNQLEKIPDDIISDPSLTREKSIVCPKCNGQEAIFIQAKASPSDDRMRLIFVCTNPACCYKWQG